MDCAGGSREICPCPHDRCCLGCQVNRFNLFLPFRSSFLFPLPFLLSSTSLSSDSWSFNIILSISVNLILCILFPLFRSLFSSRSPSPSPPLPSSQSLFFYPSHRYLSGRKEERVAASLLLEGPSVVPEGKNFYLRFTSASFNTILPYSYHIILPSFFCTIN